MILFDDYLRKLENILEFIEIPKIKDKFTGGSTFRGIYDNVIEYQNFTNAQEKAIDNVYYKWKIDQWADMQKRK